MRSLKQRLSSLTTIFSVILQEEVVFDMEEKIALWLERVIWALLNLGVLSQRKFKQAVLIVGETQSPGLGRFTFHYM